MSLVYFYLYLPLLVLILYSVNKNRFSIHWQGLSWHWYQILLHDSNLWLAFLNSVILGVLASLIATMTALVACIHLFLHRQSVGIFQKSQDLIHLMLLLIIIPDLVVGISLLIFFNLSKLSMGFFSLLIAHITFCLPYVILTISNRMSLIDANVYLSALDLGASRFHALMKVLLPMLWPAILSATLLCFTLSFDDVIISYFVSGPDFTILPLTIYSLVRAGVTPELNALCTITFIISMILVIISHFLSKEHG